MEDIENEVGSYMQRIGQPNVDVKHIDLKPFYEYVQNQHTLPQKRAESLGC
jgi:hypothetical protein